MKKRISDFIANHSVLILIVCLLLIIPSIFGYINTRINYDILVYLPESVDTIKGENILTDDFGLGAYAFVIVDSTNTKKILDLEKEIKQIEGVGRVFSLADVTDTAIPIEMLPEKIVDKLNKDDETIIMVTFDGSTSEDKTLEAVTNLREVVGDATKVSSMTSMVIDTKDLSSKEIMAYVIIAVIFCLAILFLATDSYIIPSLLLGNIGVAILYNMGTNIFLGEISYITKAITAILQLGVTMDFSIFLYHKYEQAKENNSNLNKYEAMSIAIRETFQSVIGSSLTTFAGFLALCTMDLTLGTDIGIVMAKGVICGLICVLTLFPALLIVFDKLINKTKHKNIFPKFTSVQNFCVKHYKGIIAFFLILLIPAYIGNSNYDVYYKLDESLPSDLAFNVANSKLAEKFNIISPEIILLDKNISNSKINDLVNELKQVEGIDLVLAPNTFVNDGIKNILPDDLANLLSSDNYQLIILNSIYEIASNELGDQIKVVDELVKKYDDKAIIAGEGPLMNDLVTIADHDFKMVNYTSIIVIFIIMVFVLKQVTLPIILVLAIEFAIFINMAIAFYTNTSLPFIASIVVGTIQLGATIDYAILMSTKYLELRNIYTDKKEALKETLKLTVPSIITSALCFFAATFGVAIYTKIDMIGSICNLLARGSIISMLVVITILPSLLLITDRIIVKKKKEGKLMKNTKKAVALTLIGAMIIAPITALAVQKSETIFAHSDYEGKNVKTIVNNKLEVNKKGDVVDNSILTNILNLNGEEKFELDGNNIVWQGDNKDILYQGTTKKALPINVVTKIYFNNKLVKNVKDIEGKKGSIKIEINLLNNSLIRTDNVFVPFVSLVGTMIDNEVNSNIKINNGKVVNTGSRSIVLGLSTPGLYESTKINEFKDLNKVTISYDTQDFNLNEIYIVSNPKVLSEIDFNVFDKLDKLVASVNLLEENMDLLESGAKELENGSLKLGNGSDEISKNLKELVNGLNALKEGSVSLDKGISQIYNSLIPLMEKIDFEKINELNNTNKETIEKFKSIESTYQNLSAKLNIDKMTIEEISVAYKDLINPETNKPMLPTIIEVKSMYEDKLAYNTINSLLPLLEANYSVSSLLVSKKDDFIALTNGLKQIKNGTTELSEGLKSAYNGTVLLSNGFEQLNKGIKELNKGTTTLSNGIEKFNKEGIDVLGSYTNKINSYSNNFRKVVKASKNYNGFATNNASNTTLIYKINN